MIKASPITPVISIAEKNEDPEIKYSKPLDEIKEMYVKTLQNRKDKNAKREILTSVLKKVAVVAGILIFGVLAGFIIKSKPGNDIKESAEKTLPSLPVGDNNQPEEIAEAIPEKEESLLESVSASTIEQE